MNDAVHLDEIDRRLLDELQARFPLTSRPFAVLAQRLGLDEAETLRRVQQLKAQGLVRQIGAIFDSRRLGYHSTLAAFRVTDDSLDEAAAVVGRHPGVSHNYARDHAFNLWFTLTVPPEENVADQVARLARKAGVEQYLLLPAERVFKIGVNFRMSAPRRDENIPRKGEAHTVSCGCLTPTSRHVPMDTGRIYFRGSDTEPDGASDAPARHSRRPPSPAIALSTLDRDLVRELQADLALVSMPFAPMAARLALTEENLFARARTFEQTGVMRRFGAVLRHRRAGYRANGMGCWIVPPAQCEAVGQRMAQFAAVSHCYQRPAYPPDWPYRLFTMIHGHDRDEVEATAHRIAQATGVTDYVVLYSTREYKKERVKYFVEEER